MIVEYDARWPAMFAEAAAELHRVSGNSWEIEHIGSTSVPGLAAKPVIDLAVRVRSWRELEAHDVRLAAVGWLDVGAGPRTHQVRVKHDGSGRRTHIAHFFLAAGWESCHQRLFATWLRDHPKDRRLYERWKRAAVADGLVGREYTARKTRVIQEIVDRAYTARGLPSVDVWDK